MGKKRLDWIDRLRGIGIILVVWGHLNSPISVQTVIYSFHMPLFFFISGYLYRKKNINAKEFIFKKARSLLIPYGIYELLSMLALVIVSMIKGVQLKPVEMILNFFYINGSVGWNSPIWFLIVLFIVDCCFFIIDKINMKKPIVFILLTGVAFVAFSLPTRYPLGLNIAVIGLVFYYLGNLVKEKQVVEKLSKNTINAIASVLILSTINVIFSLVLNQRISIYWNEVGNFLYFLIAAVSGIVSLTLIAYNVKLPKFFEFFGKNSLIIMATHYFFIFALKGFNSEFMANEHLLFSLLILLIIMLLYVPIIMFIKKYIPVLAGVKKSIKK